MSRVSDAIGVLLGVSTYQKPPLTSVSLSSSAVEKIRETMAGGQLQPIPQTQTRWYLDQLEAARVMADSGDISKAAKLCAAMRVDGTLAGLESTLTSGVVRLPRRFYGKNEELKAELQKNNGTRSVFDEMFPPAELALLLGDGKKLGVGVGELLPVKGRDYPVFTRLEPEFLRYRWNENRWYYNSVAGAIPITPGDGRWILHTPGGRINPWRGGLWYALGRSYIKKEHALLHQANYSAKLANPARVAQSVPGATEGERQGFLSALIAWGINTVFEMPPGWEVKLIESNGRGWEVFTKEIEQADQEMMITLAGQILTTTGGEGFSNADVGRLIRGDILQDSADALSHTLNTQGLPYFAWLRGGDAEVENGLAVEYQTKIPKDHEKEATTMVQVAAGISAMREALAPDNKAPETDELLTRFGLPSRNLTPEEVAERKAVKEAAKEAAKPNEEKESTDVAATAA